MVEVDIVMVGLVKVDIVVVGIVKFDIVIVSIVEFDVAVVGIVKILLDTVAVDMVVGIVVVTSLFKLPVDEVHIYVYNTLLMFAVAIDIITHNVELLK